jgi:PPP family 3-phenylpropionic acid transporter
MMSVFLSTALVLVALPYLKNFAIVLVVITATTVLFAPMMPLTASASMVMLGDRKDLYGRVRLGGTIGFGLAGIFIGALVENHGLRIAFWSAAVIFFLAFFISSGLIHGNDENRKRTDWSQATNLLKNPHFLVFLFIGLSGSIAFTTINTYLFPYMKSLNAGESTMGVALAVGTLSEMPVLYFASRFIKRFQAFGVLLFALGMTGLRFMLLALVPDASFVMLVQLLNGFNYPLLFVAGVTYADEQAPPQFRATAQGLFQMTISGIGAALGGFIGGILFDTVGPRGMYFTFASMVIIVLLLVIIMRRFLPPEAEPQA